MLYGERPFYKISNCRARTFVNFRNFVKPQTFEHSLFLFTFKINNYSVCISWYDYYNDTNIWKLEVMEGPGSPF